MILQKRRGFYLRRKPDIIIIFHRPTTLGITLWRRGMISLQFHGHFFQAYTGDRMYYAGSEHP